MSYPETTTMATPYTFNLPAMDGLDFGNDDLADDMEGLTLSFPKVKIPAGGSLQFELPTRDPENPEYTRFLQGIILFFILASEFFVRYAFAGRSSAKGGKKA